MHVFSQENNTQCLICTLSNASTPCPDHVKRRLSSHALKLHDPWICTIITMCVDPLWEVKTDIIQCIHLCFSMLAISFYFVNCVIISCKLSFNSRFTRNQIPIMSFLGFKKAEPGCKMSELHLYVVKRQNWVVIIRK